MVHEADFTTRSDGSGKGFRLLALGALLMGLAACGGEVPGTPEPEPTPPWQSTETREPCDAYDPLRTPFFGDLHIHTAYSADAYIFGTRVDPRGAYSFAKGGTIALSDDQEAQTRSARIDRPLDFAAVTDHAEFFGEARLCTTPGSLLFDDELCGDLRKSESPEEQSVTTARWLFPAGIPSPPPSLPFCQTPGVDCDAAAVSVWQDVQAAAEEAYDRTSACSFTTFVGYEHTSSPRARHLHRNIIFRNHRVPAFAASHLETESGGVPQGLWAAIERDCLNAGTGCEALLIPHNSNLSGGERWQEPANATEARRRQLLEPLVEIHQQKGNSECRFDRLAGSGAGTADELCTFEQLLPANDAPFEAPPPIDRYPQRNLVRNTLKEGLRYAQREGVNPFKLGFVGSTDTHNATGGNTAETDWEGGHGNGDSSPRVQIGREMRTNPGGLAVAWAEENSRDAIFAALARRETYATSGTRITVRFFAGDYDGLTCATPDLVKQAYARGVPMGGDLTLRDDAASPRFLVWAVKDSGLPEAPGTDLQRIQIIKGWVDDAGGTHEAIFDAAGRADNGASVAPATCAPVGSGARELCAWWTDPAFDPRQHAFYYARVLENPTCRWSTRVCKSVGVDPFSAGCSRQAEVAGAAFTQCCLGPGNDAYMEPVIQERAWTSPIWYRPEPGP